MSLFRRKRVADPKRDLVPVTFDEALRAFKDLDETRVVTLTLSATKGVFPQDVVWLEPEYAEMLGIERGNEQA